MKCEIHPNQIENRSVVNNNQMVDNLYDYLGDRVIAEQTLQMKQPIFPEEPVLVVSNEYH